MRRRKRAVSKKRFIVRESVYEDIQKLAYKFFEDRGHRHGWDLDDWLRAEQILKAKR